ncbi:hypothetical protein AMECASPLE_005640 [Ameca splendens]|uniref:RING-type domain-containing protein n=1 Tax=Ameca splendens TaxID=208324 RepID=A0ABV0XZL4_9TELE
MDDQGCPRCKTTKYRNPSLKLMVNVCGHTLCENCVEMLFARGSGSCMQCDTPLRKSNFRVQLFEDATVDKEVEIRKKVMKIYNKREFNFSSLRDYNDYLEQVEDIGRSTSWKASVWNNWDVFSFGSELFNKHRRQTVHWIREYFNKEKQVLLRIFSLDGLCVTINVQCLCY